MIHRPACFPSEAREELLDRQGIAPREEPVPWGKALKIALGQAEDAVQCLG